MAKTESFTALVVDEVTGGGVTATVKELDAASLPEGDVTVKVAHSTVNYKDGLILKGVGRLVKTYPHIPGIDFAGTVQSSDSPVFKPGRSGHPDRMAGWRGALGRLRRPGSSQGRMAGPAAGRTDPSAEHGYRYGRADRHAGPDEPGGPRSYPR